MLDSITHSMFLLMQLNEYLYIKIICPGYIPHCSVFFIHSFVFIFVIVICIKPLHCRHLVNLLNLNQLSSDLFKLLVSILPIPYLLVFFPRANKFFKLHFIFFHVVIMMIYHWVQIHMIFRFCSNLPKV
jgi:hypothetical protein